MPKLKTETNETKTMGDIRSSNVRSALFSFVERVERLEEEKAGLAEDIKEVYGEAKSTGFDAGIMRKVISRRKLDGATREENDALLEMYEEAVAEEEKHRFKSSVAEGE